MIRLAKKDEVERIIEVYSEARAFMRRNGNPTQWGNVYPQTELLLDDIDKNELFVVINEETNEICGSFALIFGVDPTYGVIEGGEWKSDAPYAAIHRVGSDGTKHGVFSEIVGFARAKYDHLRIDTHDDNKPMQHVILKQGFEYRGIIYLPDGAPRRAYEWIKE